MKNFVAANPRDLPTERNDCAVRAVSLALNVPYQRAHEALERRGRKFGRSTCVALISGALTDLRGMLVELTPTPRRERPTFAQFARENPKGRWVIIRSGHAVALIDGVYHDSDPSLCGARCRVRMFAKVG